MINRRSIITGILALAASGLALLSATCGIIRGSGRTADKEIAIRDITGVTLACQGDLVIERGDRETLRVEGEDNLLPCLDIRQERDTLVIGMQPAVWIQPTRPLRFHLTVTRLERVALAGSGSVVVPDLDEERVSIRLSGSGTVHTGHLQAGVVTLDIQGSGNVRCAEIRTPGLRLGIGGSGDMIIENCAADWTESDISGSGSLSIKRGTLKEQIIRVSGTGDYDAGAVDGSEASVTLTGAGTVTVRTDARLSARVAGSGGVRYYGQPMVETAVTGTGYVSAAASP